MFGLLKFSTMICSLALMCSFSQDASIGASVGGDKSPDGKCTARCDLADKYHHRNTSGIDFAGLCVFTSLQHAGIWQDDPLFEKMHEFMESHMGGGWPQKVDAMLLEASKKYGLEIPPYMQVQSNDLEVLKLAIKCGYMPCVTYYVSPTGRYGGRRIAHMVNIIMAPEPGSNEGWFCVLDNNYIGGQNYEWMTQAEFIKTYTGGSTGWSVILLTLPTPPRVIES